MAVRIYISIILVILGFTDIKAYKSNDDKNKSDSLRKANNSSSYIEHINSMIDRFDSLYINMLSDNNIPEDSNSVNLFNMFENRIYKLNTNTPIELDYNPIVQNYIDLYLSQKSLLLAKMIGTSKLYYPLFEKKLDKYNLPLELKHLAVVESALNPLAVSSSGAVGLWQFLFDTGTMLGLEINSYVDERRDPEKSTEAACQYLEYLYNIFGDWQLALAAYNGGPKVVRNAIIRSGGLTDYWDIRPYLPKETQGYVPAFIAVNYIMNYYKYHGITPVNPGIIYYQTDTVTIHKPVSLNQISEKLNIPISTLKFLNPVYKQYYIPESEIPARITLPSDKISEFLKIEDDFKPDKDDNKVYTSNEEKVKLIHTVKKGEYLHILSVKYKCDNEDIKKWNNLSEDALKTGQQLIIYVPRSLAYRYRDEIAPSNNSMDNTNDKSSKYIYYTFQKGDNLKDIAARISRLSVEEILYINNLRSIDDIKAGTVLIIDYK
ncbi:MAG: hypothetical protein Kow0068_17030 [Marinilabiliales bacterium]